MLQKPTKKQHYVPQVYLKGFSNDGLHLFSYSFAENKGLIERNVPIESVCRKNYLYEMKDNNEEWIGLNYLERCFSNLEGMFSTHLNMLNQKAFNKYNYKTKCFFTSDEKAFWKLYISLQMLRTPKVLDTASTFSYEYFNNRITPNEANCIAFQQLFPFFKELKPNDKNGLTAFLEVLQPMSIALGVDYSGKIITSDNPVNIYSKDKSLFSCEKIIFPLTSNLVLFLFGGQLQNNYDKNRLFEIKGNEVETIIKSVVCCADDFIFSKEPLDEITKEYIISVNDYQMDIEDIDSVNS